MMTAANFKPRMQDGRALLEALAGAPVRGVEPSGWLVVDGGSDNELGIMRVAETLIWAAFLIQKVSEASCNYPKIVCPCVCVA